MFVIKNVQSKQVLVHVPTIEVAASEVRRLNPSAWKGLHPLAVMQKAGGELFPLCQADELRLETMVGIKKTMTGE